MTGDADLDWRPIERTDVAAWSHSGQDAAAVSRDPA